MAAGGAAPSLGAPSRSSLPPRFAGCTAGSASAPTSTASGSLRATRRSASCTAVGDAPARRRVASRAPRATRPSASCTAAAGGARSRLRARQDPRTVTNWRWEKPSFACVMEGASAAWCRDAPRARRAEPPCAARTVGGGGARFADARRWLATTLPCARSASKQAMSAPLPGLMPLRRRQVKLPQTYLRRRGILFLPSACADDSRRVSTARHSNHRGNHDRLLRRSLSLT
mmetsp:Transcript_39620/g.74393  ORF Transcript_39620/g.74393 Transcript_39620/m.74393 type:complete len:230 (+) Transcript_39620:1592-2281(+)